MQFDTIFPSINASVELKMWKEQFGPLTRSSSTEEDIREPRRETSKWFYFFHLKFRNFMTGVDKIYKHLFLFNYYLFPETWNKQIDFPLIVS